MSKIEEIRKRVKEQSYERHDVFEDLQTLLDMLDDANKVISFYGEMYNWAAELRKEGSNMMAVFKLPDNEKIGTHYWCGKRAREWKKKWGME